MKRITPSLLIIAGLAMLLAVTLGCYAATVNQLDSELQDLQLVLNRTQSALVLTTNDLVLVNAALAEERAEIALEGTLRAFESIDELKQFLADDKTNEQTYIKPHFDCDDFAMMLQANAFRQGYIMNCEYQFHHMFCMAVIGNEIHRVEPETDEVTFMAYVDWE